MVRSAQTVHLSCIKICSISKQTESSIHLSLITKEYHQVRPKWFLSLWYVRCKPCTYLVSRLALSLNKLNQASTWASHLVVSSSASKTISKLVVRFVQTVHQSCVKISTISNELNQASTWALSPRSIIEAVQNDFWAYDMFSTNHAPILHRHQHYLKIDQNEIWHDPHHLWVPSGASKTISDVVVRVAQTVLLSCVKISTIFEWTELSFHLSIVT
jgi:hypothetical protein